MLTKLTTDLNIIQALDDQPNDVGGLTAEALKEKFDEAGNIVKTFVNDTLIDEIENKFTNIEGAGRTVETIKGAYDNLETHKTSSDHDGRYYTETELNNGQLDNRYYTETEIDGKLNMTTGAPTSIDGVTNATGNIDLIGGTGITITPNNTAKTITITATGESLPAAHGATHEPGGLDEIPTLVSHLANNINPHSTTKAQVGLGSLENYGVATQSEAESGTVDNKYMTPQRTKQAVTALIGSVQLRLNNGELEFYSGGVWQSVGIQPTKPRGYQTQTTLAAINTWYTMLDITGKGLVNRVTIFRSTVILPFAIRVTIDGETIIIGDTVTSNNNLGRRIDTSMLEYLIMSYFKTALKIEVLCSDSNALSSVGIAIDYALV